MISKSMTRRGWQCVWAALALTAFLPLVTLAARGDEASEKKGAALMDKFVEVTGGKAAYDAVKSRIVKAEATMPGGGMTGKMEVHAKYPDKFRAPSPSQVEHSNAARMARPSGSASPRSAIRSWKAPIASPPSGKARKIDSASGGTHTRKRITRATRTSMANPPPRSC